MRSFTVKKGIGSVVGEILQYTQTDKQKTTEPIDIIILGKLLIFQVLDI